MKSFGLMRKPSLTPSTGELLHSCQRNEQQDEQILTLETVPNEAPTLTAAAGGLFPNSVRM